MFVEERRAAEDEDRAVFAHFSATIANFAGQVKRSKALKGRDLYRPGTQGPRLTPEGFVRGGPDERRSMMKTIEKFGPESIPVDLDRYRKYRVLAQRSPLVEASGGGSPAAIGHRLDPREE